MIKDIVPFILVAVGAVVLQILLTIASGIFSRSQTIPNRKLMGKLSFYSLVFSFVVFLVIGFSIVPIFVKLFTDALPSVITESDFPKTIREHAWTIVYVFWGGYVLGLIIALPSIRKSDFFQPEVPPPTDKPGQQ